MSKLFSHRGVCAWALLVAVTAVMVVPAGAAVPWFDRFETNHVPNSTLTATNGWAASSGAVVTNRESAFDWDVGQPNTGDVPTPTNVLYVAQDVSVTNTVSGAPTAEKIWVDMYVVPNPYDGATANREVDGSASALFFVSSNNYITVHDGGTSGGTNWVELTGASASVVTGDMNRITLFMDYGNKEYALFLNNLLLETGIKFVDDSNTNLTKLIFADNVYVDNLWVSTNWPDGGLIDDGNSIALSGDSDGDGIWDAYEIHYFGNLTTATATSDSDGDGRTDLMEFRARTDPTDPLDASWVIPYYQKFAEDITAAFGDAYNNAISDLGTSTIQIKDLGAGGLQMVDTKALAVSGGGLALELEGDGRTNVFVQLYVKPVLSPYLPDLSSDDITTAIVITDDDVNTDTNLWVFSGTNWVALPGMPKVPTNQWLGFALHLDYNASNFNVFVSTEGDFTLHMDRANPAALPFGSNSTATSFTQLIVTNESSVTGYVDAIAVSLTYADVNEADYTNLAIFAREAGTINQTTIPPYDYNTNTTDATLAGRLGRDLAISLSPGDHVSFFGGSSNGMWKSFGLNDAGAWVARTSVHQPVSTAPEDFKLWQGMGLNLVRGPGDDTLAFYPYSNIVDSIVLTAYAKNDTDYYGKTEIAVPATLGRCIDINDAAFMKGNDNGDELIFWDAERQASLKFTWSTTQSRWIRGGVVGSHSVCPGDAFVIYRRINEDLTWHVN